MCHTSCFLQLQLNIYEPILMILLLEDKLFNSPLFYPKKFRHRMEQESLKVTVYASSREYNSSALIPWFYSVNFIDELNSS